MMPVVGACTYMLHCISFKVLIKKKECKEQLVADLLLTASQGKVYTMHRLVCLPAISASVFKTHDVEMSYCLFKCGE